MRAFFVACGRLTRVRGFAITVKVSLQMIDAAADGVLGVFRSLGDALAYVVFGGVSIRKPLISLLCGTNKISWQIHFQYASDTGSEIGDWVGRVTLEKFDDNWDDF